jgi:hypothetical protein
MRRGVESSGLHELHDRLVLPGVCELRGRLELRFVRGVRRGVRSR